MDRERCGGAGKHAPGGEGDCGQMVRRSGAIVVADADDGARALVVGALRRAGYETIEVTTGLEALEAGRRDEIGMLVLEVLLPEMTGYEVCRELRTERGEEL